VPALDLAIARNEHRLAGPVVRKTHVSSATTSTAAPSNPTGHRRELGPELHAIPRPTVPPPRGP
jgi:hypothetical protein